MFTLFRKSQALTLKRLRSSGGVHCSDTTGVLPCQQLYPFCGYVQYAQMCGSSNCRLISVTIRAGSLRNNSLLKKLGGSAQCQPLRARLICYGGAII
eukprot:6463525-Amphidinium_carterae.1